MGTAFGPVLPADPRRCNCCTGGITTNGNCYSTSILPYSLMSTLDSFDLSLDSGASYGKGSTHSHNLWYQYLPQIPQQHLFTSCNHLKRKKYVLSLPIWSTFSTTLLDLQYDPWFAKEGLSIDGSLISSIQTLIRTSTISILPLEYKLGNHFERSRVTLLYDMMCSISLSTVVIALSWPLGVIGKMVVNLTDFSLWHRVVGTTSLPSISISSPFSRD